MSNYRSSPPLRRLPGTWTAIPSTTVWVRYRLLAPVPLVVAFPSAVYEITWCHDRHWHWLNLAMLGTSGGRKIYRYADPAAPGRFGHDAEAVFTVGVE